MAANIKVIIGSVRTARAGSSVADWVMSAVSNRNSRFELIDLKDVALPWFDEPAPPMAGQPTIHESTKEWSRVIGGADGFVFIVPEYNHGYPPALKNAVDHLYEEWRGKPVALVGYGSEGAKHSIRQLREVLEFVGMTPLAEQVGINEIWNAFDEHGRLKPENVTGDLPVLLDRLEQALPQPAGAEA